MIKTSKRKSNHGRERAVKKRNIKATAVKKPMMAGSELTTKKQKLQKLLPGRFPVIMVEKFRNWGNTQQMNVLSVRPKSVEEVEQVIDAIKSYNKTIEGKSEPTLSIRCVGDGHSWSPLFPDDGNVLMYTSELVLDSGERIQLNEPSSKDGDITVTVVPGVTTGDLSKFFKKNNVCLKSDVILDKVTYGGVIATGCHGVGQDQKSVSDYVTEMSIVGVDAKETTYNFAKIDDADRVNSLKCNLGLFGIMTNITMVVEPMVIVKTENDFSHTVKDVFYDPDKLKELHDNNWSVEIFWFPFNSLCWRSLLMVGLLGEIKDYWLIAQLLRYLMAKCAWNPKEDKLWIRKINIAEVPQEPCPSEVDYAIQDVNGLVSTGFGRLSSERLKKHPAFIPSFLKAGFDLIEQFNNGSRFEPINKAIHYQSFIEVIPVVDMEFAFNGSSNTFSMQAEAMQKVVIKCKSLYDELKFPLSVAMEMRWIADSDCLICPARAVQDKNREQTLYLEVLGIADQQDWDTFTKDIAKEWMEMKFNGKAPVPHWAKQWSYLDGIHGHIQEAYGENLEKFCRQVTEEEKVLFSNETLNKAIFEDAPKTVPEQKPRSTKASNMSSKTELTMEEVADNLKILEETGLEMTLNKHENGWKVFFRTLAEQVWNVPNLVPMMNIQRECEFFEGLSDELADKFKKHLSVDDILFRDMFK